MSGGPAPLGPPNLMGPSNVKEPAGGETDSYRRSCLRISATIYIVFSVGQSWNANRGVKSRASGLGGAGTARVRSERLGPCTSASDAERTPRAVRERLRQ